MLTTSVPQVEHYSAFNKANMHSRIVTLFFVVVTGFAIFATATGSCNTGAVQCCSSLQETSSTNLAQALAGGGLLGIQIDAIINGITGLVGLSCVPLSLIALSGNTCSTQPVCCTNNFIGGIIQAGCTPVNIGA